MGAADSRARACAVKLGGCEVSAQFAIRRISCWLIALSIAIGTFALSTSSAQAQVCPQPVPRTYILSIEGVTFSPAATEKAASHGLVIQVVVTTNSYFGPACAVKSSLRTSSARIRWVVTNISTKVLTGATIACAIYDSEGLYLGTATAGSGIPKLAPTDSFAYSGSAVYASHIDDGTLLQQDPQTAKCLIDGSFADS